MRLVKWAGICFVVCACEDATELLDRDAGGPDVGADSRVFDAAPDGALDAATDGPSPDAAAGDVGADAAVDGSVDAAPDVADPDAAEPDMLAPDMGPQACDPPLSITPEAATRLPFGILYFEAAGGTGEYRYALTDDQSGALLRDNAGIYLAGESIGAVDTVTVSDLGCVGEATATVEIVPAPRLRPQQAEVEPNTVIQFEVVGGSGDVSFELTAAGSGGRITEDGRYTAGPNLGTDRVRATDDGVEISADALIQIVEEATLVPTVRRLYIPVGSTHPVTLRGGSGAFLYSVNGDRATVDAEGNVTGVRRGNTRLDVRDEFQDLTARVELRIVESLQGPSGPIGDSQSAGRTIGRGDLDGDGFPDVLAGSFEVDVDYYNDGAIYVYAGNGEGLDAAPAQVITPGQRNAELGRDFDLADLDGDGQLDLIVGARLFDVGAGDTGAVLIYRGVDAGFFEPEPDQILGGLQNGDHFGMSVAACDFNGDGRLDLAVGAFLWEDRDADPISNNQGAVQIHLGYEDGFLARPDQILAGRPLVDGAFEPAANLQFGWEVAAGDLDGDGLCDLAAHSLNYRSQPNRPNDGLVQVFRGRAPDPDSPGGVSRDPVLNIEGRQADASSQAGRRMVMADVDGDTRAELLIGSHRADLDGLRERGRIDLFDLDDLPQQAARAPVDTDASDWVVWGPQANDNLGWGVDAGDFDGDGVLDIVAGVPAGEGPEGPNNTGAVYVYLGTRRGLPAAEPLRFTVGLLGGDRMGEDATLIGDVDGDGAADFLGFAGRQDDLGPETGRTYLVPGDPTMPALPLEMPRSPDSTGAWFGRGMAFVGDVDGNGQDDFIAGAPQIAFLPRGARAGAVYAYNGAAAQPEPREIKDFENHFGFDYLGWNVALLGDFDGDGRDDWAVSARNGEHSNQPQLYAQQGVCARRGNSQGSVFVFKGGANTFESEPAWSLHGTANNTTLQFIAGGFDFNGDGLADIAASSHQWDVPGTNDVGGVQIYLGRAADGEGRRIAMCDPVLEYNGTTASQLLGTAVVGVPDLDGDGCDELAVGAQLDDGGGVNNQGAVYIFYGFGAGCADAARMAKLTFGVANAQAGISLALGELDGDDLPDLAVGGVGFTSDGVSTGGARIIRGIRLRSLVPGPVQPDEGLGTVIEDPEFYAPGGTVGERSGSAVGIVNGMLAVGGPFGDASGVPQTGVIRVYDVSVRGVDQTPFALFVGETFRERGRTGEQIVAGVLDGVPHLATSGFDASGAGLDTGAVYLLNMDR